MHKVRRADIDTLRGVSVISVVIYHFNNLIFPNGYLGVDLFFVISGFVITKSILGKIEKKKFSFIDFYIKRARRILPAFLLVLLITLIASSFILLTSDLKRYTESLITSLSFVSNFYFWLTGGYFSTNDQLKPLLHLWSLSVEEQFYLIFPLLVFFSFKFFKKLKFFIFIVLITSIVSFSLNLLFLKNTDAVFFLFPARIWEFGIGILFALLPSLKIKNVILEAIYLLIAIFLIIFNFFYIIEFLPDATLMCLGLGLILFKPVNERNILSNIFQLKPLIFIGLISYSLYLWHWPIISFFKYTSMDNLSFSQIILSSILILSLSILSWKFVEQPFLNNYSQKKLFKFISLNYFILLFIAILIIFSQNLPSRYSNYSNLLAESVGSTYDCPPIKYRKFFDTYGCYVNSNLDGDPKSVLYGNSHAYMYGWPYIKSLKERKKKGLIIQFSCLPYIDKNFSRQCLQRAKTRFESVISSKTINTVYIGLTWYSDKLIDENGNTFIDKNFELRKNSIDFLIKSFQENNKNVYLIGPTPKPGYDFASEYSRNLVFEKKKYDIKHSAEKFEKKYKTIIDYYKKKMGKNFLQPHQFLCDKKYCYYADKNGSFYSDSNHLSKYGSNKMISLFQN